jgi:hypothetical protein
MFYNIWLEKFDDEGYFERSVAAYRFKAEGHVAMFVCEIPY